MEPLDNVIFFLTFQQTYTATLPKTLFLAINQKGVSLLEIKSFVSINLERKVQIVHISYWIIIHASCFHFLPENYINAKIFITC